VDRFLTLALLATAAGLGCGGGGTFENAEPETVPLTTAAMAGQQVSVYPLTLLAVDRSLGWDDYVQPRRTALDRADSLIAVLLTERAPEVIWVLPEEMRRAARKAPGLLADPDRMGTAVLRAPFKQVPDPLRSQMRTLSGVAGGRYALVPASLVFFADSAGGRAELTLVIVDVRTGLPRWRSIARGTGDDPWSATWAALISLIPGLP